MPDPNPDRLLLPLALGALERKELLTATRENTAKIASLTRIAEAHESRLDRKSA